MLITSKVCAIWSIFIEVSSLKKRNAEHTKLIMAACANFPWCADDGDQ